MRINKKIGDLAFKCRGLFWGLFAAGILIFPGRFHIARFLAGALLLVWGQYIRWRAAGFIPKYRTEVIGAPVLVTWGPYRWVRNPLYMGNFIMGMGWAAMCGWGWMLAFMTAFALLYCLLVIPSEEQFLADKFKEKYEAYRAVVPPLFPYPRRGFTPASPDERPFDAGAAWSMEIHSMRMNLIITAVIIARLYFTTR